MGKDEVARQRSQIIVLGMHRSGTSVVTRTLNQMGAYCGPRSIFLAPNEENPKGFWERKDVRKLCDYLLNSVGADWWKIANFTVDKIAEAARTQAAEEFDRILATLKSRRPWVVKEPRLCLVFPVLRQQLDSPVCVLVFRNPLEVALSLKTRNGFPLPVGLALWEFYYCSVINATQGLPRVIVSYKDLLARPMKTIRGLCRALEAFEVRDLSVPSRDKVGRFVDRSLYRERVEAPNHEAFLVRSQCELIKAFEDESILDVRTTLSVSDFALAVLSDFEETKTKTDVLDHDFKRLRKEVHDRANEAGEIERELVIRDEMIRTRDTKIARQEKELTRLGTEVQERSEETRRLSEGLQARDETISERDGRVASKEREIERLAAEVQERSEEIRRLSEGLQARDETIRARNTKIAARKKEIRRLVHKVRERSAQVRRLTRALSVRDQTIATLKDEIEPYRVNFARSEHENDARNKYTNKIIGSHQVPVSETVTTQATPGLATGSHQDGKQTSKVYKPEHITLHSDGTTRRAARRARLVSLRQLCVSHTDLTDFEKIIASERKYILANFNAPIRNPSQRIQNADKTGRQLDENTATPQETMDIILERITCSVCGESGQVFKGNKSIREGLRCRACGASLR